MRGCSALRDPICYSFLLFAISQGFSIPYQFLENRNEQSCMSSQGWDHEKGHLLGFLSVTPFSDSLQWRYLNVIYSVMPLLLRIWNAFWPFQDCYLLGFVSAQFFLLPKAALYEHIETCVSANKAHLFHLRLGSPASFFSSTPVPRSWSTKTVTSGTQTGTWWMPLASGRSDC